MFDCPISGEFMRFLKFQIIAVFILTMSQFGRADAQIDVIFMGDSITQFWKPAQPDFFNGRILNRGISGQTTRQMLLRFQSDVVALRPRAVHIMAGTNDIAQNEGPVPLEQTLRNIETMAEMARASGILVIIGSTLPASQFSWRPAITGAAEKIQQLNAWLTQYCATNGCTIANYYPAVVNGQGGMRKEFADDGVHPNLHGYQAMRPIAEAAIAEALNPKF